MDRVVQAKWYEQNEVDFNSIQFLCGNEVTSK